MYARAPGNLHVKINGRVRSTLPGRGAPRAFLITPQRFQVRPARHLSRPRAVVLVTGSELVRGDRRDLNGPFLAGELVRLGLEPARITIVGDGPDELRRRVWTKGFDADLLVISGGLGPTHDDRTVELLAAAAGRELDRRSARSKSEIEGVSRRIAERLRRPYADFAAGRAQAGFAARRAASRSGWQGRRRGSCSATDGCVAVALPGPPSELQRLWQSALESEPVRDVLVARATAGPAGAPLLRRERVGGRAGARGGGRRR